MSATGNQQGMPDIAQPFVGPTGLINRAWFLLLQSLYIRTGGSGGASIVPPGTVVDFAGPAANIPAGWLACGQAVSRAIYADLFTAISTTWGGGDGKTTFDLPPQNVFSKGVGSDAVGSTGGAAAVTLSVVNLPAHNHPVDDPGHTHAVTDHGHAHAVTDPGHAHTIPDTGTGGGATAGGTTGTTNTGSATTGVSVNSATTGISNQSATTGITTENTGSGDPVTILPPYATFLKIIKT